MRAGQFDEKKESTIFICASGGGYGWGEIFFDSETGKWFEHSYHCESVDLAETHDDGVSEITDLEIVLEAVIRKNAIPELLLFYDELHAKDLLTDVLKEMNSSYGEYHIDNTGFQETPYYQYYRFQNGDYAIYFSGEYYNPGRDGKFRVNFSVVSRILKERDTVSYYQYDSANKTWERFLLAENKWKNTSEPV